MAALPRRYPLFRPRNSHFHPSDETRVYRPSLTHCSSGTNRYGLELLTASELESSRVVIRSSALTIHSFPPRTKPSFFDPPSRQITLQQLDTDWHCSLLQGSSSPAPIFASPPSRSLSCSPHKTPWFPALSHAQSIRDGQLSVCVTYFSET